MDTRATSDPATTMQLVVIRADGTAEAPITVEAVGTGAELLARWHPRRFARVKWGLVAAWRRFKRDLAQED